jgi:hypothetical protein
MAQKAAERMVLYWREKVKIFGRQNAYRRLTMDDLEEQDVRAIRAGSILALPRPMSMAEVLFTVIWLVGSQNIS